MDRMGTRILLVDDDLRLTGMLAEYLGAAGLAVETAASLTAARQRLHTPPLPQALVLDLMLPDGDGLDWCRELRAHGSTRALPILMLSARGEPADRVVGLELGADDYLSKPFEARELLARLRALLRRALRNLLDNAQRYAPGAAPRVTLRADGDHVELRVANAGPGVPADERERIFEPFYRRPGHAEADGGVGLGLSLVRQIAQAHGGHVHCEDAPGGGACFVLRLPRSSARAQPSSRASASR